MAIRTVHRTKESQRLRPLYPSWHVLLKYNQGRWECIIHGRQHMVHCQKVPSDFEGRMRKASRRRRRYLRSYFTCNAWRCAVCTNTCMKCGTQPKDTRRPVLMDRTRPARDQARCLWCNEPGLRGHTECLDEPYKPYLCQFLDEVPGDECDEKAVAVLRPRWTVQPSIPVCAGCLEVARADGAEDGFLIEALERGQE